MLKVIIDFYEWGLGLFLLELTNCYDRGVKKISINVLKCRPSSILLFNMFYATAIYIFDSYLIWKMQLTIIKG